MGSGVADRDSAAAARGNGSFQWDYRPCHSVGGATGVFGIKEQPQDLFAATIRFTPREIEACTGDFCLISSGILLASDYSTD